MSSGITKVNLVLVPYWLWRSQVASVNEPKKICKDNLVLTSGYLENLFSKLECFCLYYFGQSYQPTEYLVL